MEHIKSRISLERIFILQDAVQKKHTQNNQQISLFASRSMEFCLNRNAYCINLPKCDQESLKVFNALYQEALSSLIVAYRIGLWGSVTDCYAVLRTSMEGLGFINSVVDKGDFRKIYSLIKIGKLKKGFIEKRFKCDKVLEQVWGKISESSSHFTKDRMAQRVYTLDGKQYARVATAYYEKKNELEKRLGHFLNTVFYAVLTLKDFYEKYHRGCIRQKFYDDYIKLERLYNKLANNSKQVSNRKLD